jgi:hypothetical protein
MLFFFTWRKKNLFDKCVLEFHFTSIPSLGGSILSKKVKLAVQLIDKKIVQK